MSSDKSLKKKRNRSLKKSLKKKQPINSNKN